MKIGLINNFGLQPQIGINALAEVTEGEIVEEQKDRVMRGGSFYYIPLQARSAYRDKNRANGAKPYLGFRVVRTLPVPASPKK
jgi:formylglycine-generating enzyme required for sulfatase activity